MNFRPYILKHQKRHDGRYNVKIRISHRGSVSYAPTELYVNDSQLSADGDVKDLKILRICADIVDRYEEIFRANYFEVAAMETANELRDFLVRKSTPFRLDFWTFSKRIIEQRLKTGHAKTAECMARSVHAFRDYMRVQVLDVSAITPSVIRGFMDHLREPRRVCRRDQFGRLNVVHKEALTDSSAKAYAVDLRTIFNCARAEYNVDDVLIRNNPFAGVNLSRRADSSAGFRALELDEVARIFSSSPAGELEKMARDVFCISFCLCGANVTDIYSMPALTNGRAEYCRMKTKGRRADKAFVSVKVPDVIATECREWCSRRSDRLAFRFSEMYSSKDGFLRAVNDGLHSLARHLGISDLTSYYARHSWATIARNCCGLNIEDISAALNHVAKDRVTDRYIKRDFSRIDSANEAVLKAVLGEG